MSMPKVLITGASGLIGGLTIAGLGHKYEFSGLSRRPVARAPSTFLGEMYTGSALVAAKVHSLTDRWRRLRPWPSSWRRMPAPPSPARPSMPLGEPIPSLHKPMYRPVIIGRAAIQQRLSAYTLVSRRCFSATLTPMCSTGNRCRGQGKSTPTLNRANP